MTNQFDLEAAIVLLLGGVVLGGLAVLGTIIVVALGWHEKANRARGETTVGPESNLGSPMGPGH